MPRMGFTLTSHQGLIGAVNDLPNMTVPLTVRFPNPFPAVATIHHMVDRTRILHSHSARHGPQRGELPISRQPSKNIPRLSPACLESG